MKKTTKNGLLAGAISAVMFAGMGVANAAPSATIYGNIDASVTHVDAKSGTTSTIKDKAATGDFVNSNRSYLGVKGAEDLGSASVFFKMEFENNIDESDSVLTGRNTYVGVKSGIGTVILGQGDSVFKSVEPLDTFDRHYLDAEYAGMGLGANSESGQERFSNMATFLSPQLGNFRFGVTLSSNEGSGLDSANNTTYGSLNDKVAIAVTYGSKYKPGVYLAAGYENYSADTINGMYGGGMHEGAAAWRISGQYRLHHLNVGGMYQSFDRAGGDSATEGVWVDGDNLQINVSYNLNNFTLKGKYSQTDYDASGYKTAYAYGVGLDYALSSHSHLYVEYVLSDNATLTKTNGNDYNIGQEKAETNAIAFGITHRF